MEELHRVADKFHRETTVMLDMLDRDDESPDHVELALAQAKRVRREANILVRALAQLRDKLQP